MLKTVIDALMGGEVEAICGAPHGVRSDVRTHSGKGWRVRAWDTRADTLEVAIPKLRNGSYFPDWLLERRRRAERALATVVVTCYLLGGLDPADGQAGRDSDPKRLLGVLRRRPIHVASRGPGPGRPRTAPPRERHQGSRRRSPSTTGYFRRPTQAARSP